MPSILVVAAADPRRRLVNILRQAGYLVTETDSGAGALDIVCADSPTLILMAIVMPEGNGLEVAARLRRDHNAGSPPIILLGLIPPLGMEDEPLSSLVSGYLNIDASSNDLLEAVHSHLTTNNQI